MKPERGPLGATADHLASEGVEGPYYAAVNMEDAPQVMGHDYIPAPNRATRRKQWAIAIRDAKRAAKRQARKGAT